MSGRLEKDRLIEEKIKLLVQEQPSVISGYSMSFGRKTSNTKIKYIRHVINFCTYLINEFSIDMNNYQDMQNINYSHITAYMNYISIHSPNGEYVIKESGSCAAVFYAIKHFCKYLKLCRYIQHNPCEDVEVPKDNKQRNIVSLSQDEIQIIKNNINKGVGTSKAKATQVKWKNRDLCLISLGITTGLRVSALSNIDIDDIDFQEKSIKTIEKGNVERTVYLSDKMIELIKIWMKDREVLLKDNDCNALFISAKHQRIGVTTIREMLKKYTYNINKNISPHKLRSTTATNLYDITGDIYLVADVLGHSNIQNTRRYACVSNDRRKLAANTLSKLM